MIANRHTPQHGEIAARIQGYEALFDEQAQQPVATIAAYLDSTTEKIRSQESTMGNLVADALRSACHADLAIISGGTIRGNRTYEPGSVLTFKDILSELPFGNICYMVELSGEEILEALENGLVHIEGKAGRFPQVSGIEYAFDLNQPPGRRVMYVGSDKLPLDRKAFYRVATVDYMYNGGDGYNSFKKGKLVIGSSHHIELVASVIEHCKKLGCIDMAIEDRIVSVAYSKALDDRFLQQSGVVLK